jgi:hypothetical protein
MADPRGTRPSPGTEDGEADREYSSELDEDLDGEDLDDEELDGDYDYE